MVFPLQESSSRPKYRPDIDGLRAIAIILVVGYHAFPGLFKGGFFGVDIFFVISGFLISSIILGGLEKRNFSYKEFYARRIKRIFPALILVLIVCIILGNFYFLADEYKSLGQNIAAGAAYISNLTTWAEASDYFQTGNYTQPLLHLWSLAIEEQFYIFWPLLLGFLWKIEKKQHFVLATLVVGIISFGINIILARSHPTAAFYSPPSRFWEFMAGGLLAYISIFKTHLLEYGSNLRSVIGFTIILFGLIFINQNVVWPGWWALFPTAGAFLLISAKPNAWLNQKVLSNKFFVWIGLISYPLYLWHWPLLSFSRILFGQNLPIITMLGVIAVSFILAWLTYKLIEKPIRFTKHASKTVFILVSAMSVICLFGLLLVKAGGFPNRQINNGQHLYNPYLQEIPKLPIFGVISDYSCKKIIGKQSNAREYCRTNSFSPQLLIGGDSHAGALHSSVEDKKITTPALLVSEPGCPSYAGLTTQADDCSNMTNDFISASAMPSIEYVLVVNSLVYADDPQFNFRYSYNGKLLTADNAFLLGYSNLFDKLFALNKKVVFILDVPHFPFDVRSCVKRSIFADNPKKDCRISFDAFQDSRKKYLKLVSKLKQKYPSLIIYDASKNFCDDFKCYIKDETDYFYHDNDHLTIYGSEKIWPNLLSELNIVNHY